MTKRVPVILTNIIDQLTQGKEQIVEKYGEVSKIVQKVGTSSNFCVLFLKGLP